MKAYIADDGGLELAVTGMVVEDHGYDVALFDDGESLLVHLRANPKTDLVITDYQMPGKDGLQVLREIRDAPELRELRVVVHTATLDLKAQIEEAGGIFAAKAGKPDLKDVLRLLK